MKKSLFVLVFLAALLIIGCGQQKKTPVKVDETTPAAQVKVSAAKMDAVQLQQKADEYKQALAAQQADLDKLKKQLTKIPVTETLGEKAKTLKADVEKQTVSVKNLNERLQIYLDELKKKTGPSVP